MQRTFTEFAESYYCQAKTETQLTEHDVIKEKQLKEIDSDNDSLYYERRCCIYQFYLACAIS